MYKYIIATLIALAISFGVSGLVKAQTSTVTPQVTDEPSTTVVPTRTVNPTSVPAGAPNTGYGTMAR